MRFLPLRVPALVLSPLLLACGGPDAALDVEPDAAAARAQAIVGGHRCAPDEDLSTGYVEVYVSAGANPLAKGRGACTGTLVARDVVLTAAHCVDPRALGGGATVAGARMRFTDTPDSLPIAVERIVVHPDYDPNLVATPDVALLFLARASLLPPVVIARAGDVPRIADARATVIGYGLTGPERPVQSPPVKNCGTAWLLDIRDDGLVVAGGDEQHPGFASGCSGDSGGPLFVAVKSPEGSVVRQLGVLSRGDFDCTYGIYTRTDAYASWIDEHLRPDVRRAQFLPPPPRGETSGRPYVVRVPSSPASEPATGCSHGTSASPGPLAPAVLLALLRRRRAERPGIEKAGARPPGRGLADRAHRSSLR